MVKLLPSKQVTRVRFPSPAPTVAPVAQWIEQRFPNSRKAGRRGSFRIRQGYSETGCAACLLVWLLVRGTTTAAVRASWAVLRSPPQRAVGKRPVAVSRVGAGGGPARAVFKRPVWHVEARPQVAP